MARLFAIALVVGLLPCGLAGPACAQKFKSTADCIQRCNTRWGFPGAMMGTDAWGSVMRNVGKEIDDWDLYVAKACGEENATSSSAPTALSTSSAAEQTTKVIEQGLGTHSIPSSSALPTFTSLRFVASASRLTTSTTTSHSTTVTPTSTSTTPTSTELETPTHTTAQPTHTTTQSSSNSNGSNGDSNGSNGDSNGSNGDSNGSNSDSNGSNSDSNGSNSGSTGGSNSGSTGGSNTGNGGNDSGNGSRASNADVEAYLAAHNTIREQHGAVAVAWDNAAAVKAQEWADKCTNTHSGGTLGPLGENIAAGTGAFGIAAAVKAWTDEVSEYNSNYPQPSHFTQVVWKATTVIGCAVQTCDGIFAGYGPAQYYVCEYSVQGNVIGNFGENVQA